MISHVTVCLLTHGGKSSISNTFCHTKREYSFSVRPIGCTPAFLSKIEATLLKARRTHFIIVKCSRTVSIAYLRVSYENIQIPTH